MSSLKKLETTLKELGKNNDTKSLEEFVFKIEDDVICKLVASKICHSDAPQLLNYLYQGMSKNNKMEIKRYKVMECVLKELQSLKLSNMQLNSIISRLSLEVEKLNPAHLVQFSEYCINWIQQDNEQTCWKDLLPKLLTVILTCDEVNHNGVDMTGSEYKSEVIRTLLMVQWQPSIATSLASMFTEIPLSSEQHLQIINKLCASLDQMNPSEVPPLVHQLLQLCINEHGVALFLRLQSYFSSRLYNLAQSNVTDSERTDIEMDSDNIDAASKCETQFAEATVLFHIHQAASFGHASIKNFIKYVKSVTHSPELILDPFLLTVLLSLSTISIYEEQIVDILKCAVQRLVNEEELCESSAWLRGVTPEKLNIELVFMKLMENSLQERGSVMEGLMNLAFVLLAATSPKGKESVAKKLWNLGTFVLVKLIKKHHKTTGTVLQLLTNSIITGQSVSQYTNCLYQMAKTVPLVLNEYRSTIMNLLEMLTQLSGPIAEEVVHSVLPIVRHFHSLRDVLIMVLRKALFSRNVGTRKMAVSGFLQLLKHLDVKGLAVLSSSQSSQYSGSPRHSLLTQIDMEAGNSNNEAICLELLGVLRRCFMQQAEVRLCLYEGLHSGVIRNPELSVYVQDMIISHFNQYYESDEQTLPPLKFGEAVSLKDSTVELKEPLGHLVFSIQQLVKTCNGNETPTRIVSILESLCERMVKCSLEDFCLDELTNLLDNVPESQQQQEVVRQILAVYEALMGYVLSSWTLDESSEKAQKFVNIFKGYSKVAEYVKLSARPGKKADGDGALGPQMRKLNGDKKGKGRPMTFKWPNPVLDYPTLHKMLSLLHESSLPWCSAEAANLVKGRRELNRFAMETTLKLIKSTRAEKSNFLKSVTIVNSYINIGIVLYTNCVSKLHEFREFDASTAVFALESFNELFALMCTDHKDKLGQFLGDVVNVSARDGLEKQLLELVSKYEELLTNCLAEDADMEDEPAAKKIPQLLVQGLTYISSQIPCNETCSAVLRWTRKFAQEKELPNVNLVKGIVSLLFTLEVRCKGTSELYKQFAMQLCELIGIVEDGEGIQNYTSYSVLRTGYENTVLSTLCDTVKKMLEHVDWVLQRLRAENVACQNSFANNLQARKEFLKSKEQDVVCELSHCVQILNFVSSIALEPGSMTEQVFKVLGHQYITLSSLTKYLTLRSSKTNHVFQTAKFELLLKLAGKSLSPHVYNLITHIEANQKSNKDDKRKRADPMLLKSKVLRETRCIPKLVFEVEQFEKCVIELSRKTKVNLTSCLALEEFI
ncbi:hypothetical protein C0J52_16738 [Blattella germanica]|nr:hypothetical protein C0J52_16738 [Blattella germanica]